MLDLKYSEKFYKIILTESIQNLFISRLINSGYELIDSSSFIEIEDEDMISFIPEDRVRRLFKEYQENGGKREFNNWIYEPECHKEVWTKHRIKMKIGRFLTKILNAKNNEESLNIVINRYIKDFPEQKDIKMNRHIELFVNHFKALYKTSNNRDLYNNIQLVSEENIRKWYLEDNYKIIKGSLGRSCMRGKEQQDFLEIYVDNPRNCQLLIYKEGDKISMRALLWTLDDGRQYMDRIYATNESDSIILINYANEKGWTMYDSDYNNSLEPMTITTRHIYDEYPYMDTFKYLNMDTKTHHTTAKRGMYDLTNQDGTIEEIDYDI
jgi:hypothetical protein